MLSRKGLEGRPSPPAGQCESWPAGQRQLGRDVQPASGHRVFSLVLVMKLFLELFVG